MRAILFERRGHISVYTIERVGREEGVADFLADLKNKRYGGEIRGFHQLLDRILDGEWRRLTTDNKKSWDEAGVKFSELIKGTHRLSCFLVSDLLDQRFLLVSVFRKSKMKEKREYTRAVGTYKQFLASPEWID